MPFASDEVTALLAHVENRIEELHDEARVMVDEHWAYYMAESKKRRDFSEKSRIYPRLRETQGAFAIEWYRILKWFKNNAGMWKKKTRYVARGKGDRVNLKRYAQDWEISVVNEFEDRAKLIRRELTLLTNLIAGYKRLKKQIKVEEN